MGRSSLSPALLKMSTCFTADSSPARDPRKESPMEGNKALIRHWCDEGFNKNNMAIADEVYAANVFYHEPSAGEVIGLEPLKQFVVSWRTAFPDSLLRIDEQVGENDRIATRWTFTGTHKGDFRGLAPTG